VDVEFEAFLVSSGGILEAWASRSATRIYASVVVWKVFILHTIVRKVF
jgi:hypothetical protein